jgi:AcrR family transcriptional regulator
VSAALASALVAREVPTPYPLAARELLRATLLDAMGEHLRSRPWSDVTVADVAAAAGVSRPTLYKEFGSRRELAQAYVLREVDRFLADVEEAVTAHLDDPAVALAAAFQVFLTAAAEDPLVRSIAGSDDGDELLTLVTTQGKPVLERATERLAAFILRGWPTVGNADARLLAECVVRLGISYAALPTGPASMTGASVASLLGPYVERALGGGGGGG